MSSESAVIVTGSSDVFVTTTLKVKSPPGSGTACRVRPSCRRLIFGGTSVTLTDALASSEAVPPSLSLTVTDAVFGYVPTLRVLDLVRRS